MQALFLMAAHGQFDAGDITEIRASGIALAADEVKLYAAIETPDPMSAMRQYGGVPWYTDLAYSIKSSTTATDSYTIQLYSTLASSTLGAIQQSDVSIFIQNWNGVIGPVAANSVQVDITIYNAITSVNFWDIDPAVLSKIVFSELPYYTTTNKTHQIQADYSTLGVTHATAIETHVEAKGGTVLSNANNVIVFNMPRSAVQAQFLADIQAKGRRLVKPMRYQLNSTLINLGKSAAGQIYQTDLATLQAALIDKVSL